MKLVLKLKLPPGSLLQPSPCPRALHMPSELATVCEICAKMGGQRGTSGNFCRECDWRCLKRSPAFWQNCQFYLDVAPPCSAPTENLLWAPLLSCSGFLGSIPSPFLSSSAPLLSNVASLSSLSSLCCLPCLAVCTLLALSTSLFYFICV